MKNLFQSTTLQLTAWYTLILMVISLIFSIVVFQVSYSELQYGFRVSPGTQAQNFFEFGDLGTLESWRNDRIQESKSHLIGSLVLFNVFVLAAGAAGSYMLARRTLKPVEEAMQVQARFSSDAAHELRTPLTVMQSEIEVGLRSKESSKAGYGELLRSNLEEIQHMRTLTDRLLLLANQNELSMQPTSLEQIAIEAMNRGIPLAQKKHIEIQNDIGPIQVNGNADSLTDTLYILIDNAIKYCPRKSLIKLTAAKKGHRVELRIRDNGPGITADDLPHIFDRFYRADMSRSNQNVSGHGLGLSIAQRVIKAHDGTISAKNNARGKGVTFLITLPLA